MTTKRTTPKATAAETYAARRDDIARLVDVLEAELERYDERAAAKPRDWGFPGTLDYVRSSLIDLVAGLSGMEREHIEEMLRDARATEPETKP